MGNALEITGRCNTFLTLKLRLMRESGDLTRDMETVRCYGMKIVSPSMVNGNTTSATMAK